MDFDVPTDLINKSQIGFREAVGLSSFNPNDTTLPSISTVEASISTLDPSPAYLRCKFCQGKLLRGLQSLICIYCGEFQKKDLNPDPISFNSTNGFNWLLQSLNFNGSERVGSLTDGIGINGGQSPAAEDELTLSELLDFKISLRDEPKKPENNFDIKTFDHNSSVNLGTDDLDNFFIESKRATVADVLEKQPVASKIDQNKVFEGQENLTSVTSSIDVDDGASFGWNAEFQFADSKMENENPKSVDPFVGTAVDLSAHMDTVFGQMEGSNIKKPNNDKDPFPSTGEDWIQDDPFANISSATFQQPEQLVSVVQSDHLNDLSTEGVSVDWFENANWQKNIANNTTTIKDVNLFDIKPQIDTVSTPSLVNDLIQNDHVDLNNTDKHHSDVTDWFQDSQWAIGASSSSNMVVNKVDDDDDVVDEWNDFTSSTGNQDSWKQSSNEKVGASENISELNLFPSTTDQQEVDFGNVLQSDLVSGSSSNKNPNDSQAAFDFFSEASTASRNTNAEGGNSVEGPKKDEITLNATTRAENDVHMLLSQMHDLSFMLKSELSIPSKPDDVGPSSS